ncbi:MAG: S-adenosylmethionine decarboxylase [Nanoarchaeota archaeon]|nr:S-adenosylmethionine decarboxylase [Nanoarchaeota archaeon]MBU1622770.1 S-adenosylmethionine decarboxylase [Nanoarchaeota archaeon]
MKKDPWWGRSASLDLHDCDPKLIKSPPAMRKFIRELCTLIKMKRHGPTQIQRFGHGNLRGYSLMQFIETSTIVAHFDEIDNRAFIDIFSCKTFNPQTAAKFCQTFFKAKSMTTYVEERQ